MNQIDHILSVKNRLGETPIWAPDENALYWVDWGGKPTCRLDTASGELTTYKVAPLVTSLARRSSGGWIAIAQDGIYSWDPQSNQYQLIHGPAQPDKPEISYNDAAVDRQGRLLVGTVNLNDPFLPEGSLYRLDPDGSFEELSTGYATANGIGFSPDGRTIYVADQRNYQIVALDYDPDSGTTSNRRIFATLNEENGMPDGLTVDAEGYIWNGHWAGWKLTRYAPDGSIERQIKFPVQHVISLAFGGPDLDFLYVTTSAWDFTDQDWEKQPQAGDLFLVKTGIKGLVEPAFKG
ncbi:MAG: SMP-30/gluconolactonase/LRE family protein [Anaerolineales bacterium]|nr:SMP-30/gluconolactonase/LRE family protein [Anaerolineales bacterium]